MSGRITICLQKSVTKRKFRGTVEFPGNLYSSILGDLIKDGLLTEWKDGDYEGQPCKIKEVTLLYMENKLKVQLILQRDQDGYNMNIRFDPQEIEIYEEWESQAGSSIEEALQKVTAVESALIDYEVLKYYHRDRIDVTLNVNEFSDNLIRIKVNDNYENRFQKIEYYAVERY